MAGGTNTKTIEFALYRYSPSIPAAAIFVGVFGLLALICAVRLLKHGAFFMIPFLVGLLFETAGYVGRILSHFSVLALGPYIEQTMLILLAPPLFAASIYMTLGRLITKLGADKASIIKACRMTKFFVAGDVVSFMLQSGGGGFMAEASPSAMEDGAKIVVAGLAIQLLYFGFFIVAAAVFHFRVKKDPAYYLTTKVPFSSTRFSWETLIWALYLACSLIFIRSVYRVVEFVQGNDGFIMRKEYLLYVFDATLMSITGLSLAIVFPGAFMRTQKQRRDIELFEPSSSPTSTTGRVSGK